MGHAEPKVTIDLKEYNELLEFKNKMIIGIDDIDAVKPYKLAVSAIITELSSSIHGNSVVNSNLIRHALKQVGVIISINNEKNENGIFIVKCEMYKP